MHYYIITGTSRGIGAALAQALLAPDHHLICVSRGTNEELLAQAKAKSCRLVYHQMDLGETEQLIPWMEQILAKIDPGHVDSINLIQNAAALRPIQAIGREIQADQIGLGVRVNLLAPMLMTEAFVSAVQGWPVPKRIVNLSSGAARRPVHAWSMYCSTKAALDMHSRCLAEEQTTQAYPIKVVAVAPGTVDTAMQDHLRQQSHEVFPGVQRFLDLKKEGKLWTADYVAGRLIQFMNREDFGEEVLVDLRLV